MVIQQAIKRQSGEKTAGSSKNYGQTYSTIFWAILPFCLSLLGDSVGKTALIVQFVQSPQSSHFIYTSNYLYSSSTVALWQLKLNLTILISLQNHFTVIYRIQRMEKK
jgi:hypothetical protein